jgi:phosphoglycerate kinase
MKIVSIEDRASSVSGKTVLLRLDLNVPVSGKKILDDYKLEAALPTLRFLRARNARVIIITHLGDPKPGVPKVGTSVKPLASYLSKKIKSPIPVTSMNWSSIVKDAASLKKGGFVMLENIRLFKGETENNKTFAKQLASLADVFVNDAFAVSHREHASVIGVQKFLPSFAGLLLKKEILNLEKAKAGKKPFVLIMGGAKISTKLPLIQKFLTTKATILSGGGIANTLLKAQGCALGKSLYDHSKLAVSKKLLGTSLVLPLDLAVLSNGKKIIRWADEIKNNETILDIGPKTIAQYTKIISSGRTIIWNGPMGMIERKSFELGTKAISAAIGKAVAKKAFALVGGGETVELARKHPKRYSWISTGGGASLAYLAGEQLPGLRIILRKHG